MNPCDSSNPALTATGLASIPTATLTPPQVILPTQTPTLAPLVPTVPPLPSFQGLILFDTTRDGNPEIYALDSSGQTRRMTNSPSADLQGVWDPNMRRIAFTSNRAGQNDIYIMNSDGTNPVNITNNPADDQQPAWSSDGEWIIFATNRDGNYEIYVKSWDGSDWQEVGAGSASGGGISNLDGESNNAWIAAVSDEVIYVAWQEVTCGLIVA